MSAIKFRRQYNNEGQSVIKRKNKMPSMTVPDQSMTVQEIQMRFASGIPVSNTRIPVYNGAEDFWDGRDPKSLDIVELNEIVKERIQQTIDNKRRVEKEVSERQEEAARLKGEKEAKEIAQEADRREKEIQRLMAQRRNSNNNQGVNDY